jgi:PilZ domain
MAGMSDLTSTDRRRVPRAAIADTELSVLAFPIPVRLLDISLGGVLLESSHAVDLGTRGTLRFNFGGVPFSADVKVERLERPRNGGEDRFTIGASFVALSRQDQRVIERFADQ